MDDIVWNYSYEPLIRELGLRGLNMDNAPEMNEPWNYVEKVDPDKKIKFIENYHSVSTDNKLFGEIVAEELEKL